MKIITFELLELPQSLINHNRISDNKCDGLKIIRIGKSAAKKLDKFQKFLYNIKKGKTKKKRKMERRIHDFLPEIKDYYTITSDGKIYSDNSGLMKTRNKPGTEYQIISFSTVDNNKKTFRVHRLVLLAFKPVENSQNLEVNHKDGNKKNNSLDNLEWCNDSENQIHAFKLGLQKPRRGEKSNFSKLSINDIEKIFKLREKGLTQKEIAEIIGCTRSNISYILNKKTWQV